MSDAVLDAAARLLQEEGPQALTTRRVAAAAGTQVPTIYRLFGDKDGLLGAVARHVLANYHKAKRAASAQKGGSPKPDPVSDLKDAFFMHVDFGIANPHVFALMISPSNELLSADGEGREILREKVRRVAVDGMLRVSEERAVQMVSAAGNGAILITLGAPVAERDPDLGRAMFDAVADAILTAPRTKLAEDSRSSAIIAAISLVALLPELPILTPAERAVMKEWLDRSIAASCISR